MISMLDVPRQRGLRHQGSTLIATLLEGSGASRSEDGLVSWWIVRGALLERLGEQPTH